MIKIELLIEELKKFPQEALVYSSSEGELVIVDGNNKETELGFINVYECEGDINEESVEGEGEATVY